MSALAAVRLRLLAIQACWTYEWMLGPGLGWSMLPLLEELRGRDPARHAAAVARSAAFFNCNPNLAGLAAGALARMERDGLPGDQIDRLRTALGGPLGALGDRLFWAGVVPALVALALLATAVGAGPWAAMALVGVYAAIRVAVGGWALRTGLAEGPRVGVVLARSWLPAAAAWAGIAAAVAAGLALPVLAEGAFAPLPLRLRIVGGGVAAAGIVLAARGVSRYSAVRLTLAASGAALLLHLAVR